MEWTEIEGEADYLLRMVNMDWAERVNPVLLAEGLFGAGTVFVGRFLDLPGGGYSIAGPSPKILIASKRSAEQKRWAVAHEVAELHLRRLEYREEDAEQVADSLAACLLMPRRSFREVGAAAGADFCELGALFGVTPAAAFLRWGGWRTGTGVPVSEDFLLEVASAS